MFETKPVRITELAKETEQYLLQKWCKKSTLGVYKATWHKFMAFSSSDVYSRTAAEVFLSSMAVWTWKDFRKFFISASRYKKNSFTITRCMGRDGCPKAARCYAGKEELLMNIKKSLYSQPQSVTASKPDGYMSSYGDKWVSSAPSMPILNYRTGRGQSICTSVTVQAAEAAGRASKQ